MSNADQFERVAIAFETVRAAGHDPAQRSAALAEIEAEDATLAAEVIKLLLHHDAEEDVLDRPVLDAHTVRTEEVPPEPGEHWIGAYRVIRILGEGGMGVVYLAEQQTPRRLVALKMLRPGLVSRSLSHRLTQESELLGRLQHPGIAAVLEAGTVDLGAGAQPYFAMEFVDGLSITDYAERHDLGTHDRLRLIVDVAAALQHAHDQGIIHRDLKPANILVDTNGRVRVLDFGVARLVDADARMTTLQTNVGQLIGTIPYMSTEQLDADSSIDARTDIHALGVVTYELLCGQLPHPICDCSVVEALSRLREDEPVPLSSIDRVYRGDLDTIMRTATDRDRDRRYASAAAFSRDLQRFVSGRPIEARAPSAWYLASKFARRHVALVLGSAILATVLIVATVVSLRLALLAEVRRTESETNAAALNQELVIAQIGAAAQELAGDGSRAAADRLNRLVDADQRRWEVRHLLSQVDASVNSAAVPGQDSTTSIPLGLGALHVTGAADGVSLALQTTDHAAPSAALDVRFAERPTVGADGVLTLAESPDGFFRVQQSRGMPGQLIDQRNGTVLASLTGHVGRLSAITFDPQGRWMASADAKGIVAVRRMSDGSLTAMLQVPGAPRYVHDLISSADGSKLVAAMNNGKIAAWDALHPGSAIVLPLPVRRLDRIVFLDGDSWLVAISEADGIFVIDSRSIRPPQSIPMPTDAVNCPDRSLFALSCLDGRVRFHDAFTGDLRGALPLSQDILKSIAVSDDLSRIAARDQRGRVLMFDVPSGVLYTVAEDVAIATSQIAFTPDGSTLFCANQSQISAFDIETLVQAGAPSSAPPQPLWRASLSSEDVTALAVDPTGQRLAIALRSGGVTVVDCEGGRTEFTSESASDVRIIRWIAERRLLAGSNDGRLHALELDQNARATDGVRFLRAEWVRDVHHGPVTALAYASVSKRIATGSTDRTVRILDAGSGELVLVFRDVAAPIHGLAFSDTTESLLIAALDGSVRVAAVTSASHRAAIRSWQEQQDQNVGVPPRSDLRSVPTTRQIDRETSEALAAQRRLLEAIFPPS